MPLGGRLLLGAEGADRVLPPVQLPTLGGADGADLGVAPAELTGVVEDGVDVEAGRPGPPCQFSQAQDELLLEVVGELVLGAEEDDATLGDCSDDGNVSLCGGDMYFMAYVCAYW